MGLFDSLKKLSPIGNSLSKKMGIAAPGIAGHINRMEQLPGGNTIDPLMYYANKASGGSGATDAQGNPIAPAADLSGNNLQSNMAAYYASLNRPNNQMPFPTGQPSSFYLPSAPPQMSQPLPAQQQQPAMPQLPAPSGFIGGMFPQAYGALGAANLVQQGQIDPQQLRSVLMNLGFGGGQ